MDIVLQYIYINHDPVMTLTNFMARSTWVAHAFEWEKLLKCHLKGKASKKLANGQNIDYSEKRKRPKGFICPCTGVKYHNIQTCLLVYAADSGERLQDHWSSGLIFAQNIGEVVLTSTRNLCFEAKIRKIVYPFIPQFYYILKWGVKGYLFYRHVFLMSNLIALWVYGVG